jgi:hypothetical protein
MPRNQLLHWPERRVTFPAFNVSPAAAAGEMGRSASEHCLRCQGSGGPDCSRTARRWVGPRRLGAIPDRCSRRAFRQPGHRCPGRGVLPSALRLVRRWLASGRRRGRDQRLAYRSVARVAVRRMGAPAASLHRHDRLVLIRAHRERSAVLVATGLTRRCRGRSWLGYGGRMLSAICPAFSPCSASGQRRRLTEEMRPDGEHNESRKRPRICQDRDPCNRNKQ